MIIKMKETLLNSANYLNEIEKIRLIVAMEFAEKAHRGQLRGTGEPYIIHPISVCQILTEYKADITTLISALLHDVVEDTDVPLSEIEEIFGANVAFIVDGLTKYEKGTFEKEVYHAINFEKLLTTSATDIRVAVVKIADRLHNMQTLAVKKASKKAAYANETLIFFAPLAEKLGLLKIQEELEELGFQYLNPAKYRQISKLIDNYTNIFINIFEYTSKQIEELNNNTIPLEFRWRKEPIYKSYSLLQEDHSLSELFHIEIMTDSRIHCYTALGLVHELFYPIPNKFRDNISIKVSPFSEHLYTEVLINDIKVSFEIKPNSTKEFTHSGILSLLNKPILQEEIQVISKEVLKDSIHAVQAISKDPIEFYDLITSELFRKEITVFTPKLDVCFLPEGATVIDFAFQLKPDLARKMTHVKVNGKIQDINFVLNNMDIIEIITADKITVHANWLNYALTSKAQNEINQLILNY